MEEHFKNKLKNHKVEWNKEELLDNLKQDLVTEKSTVNWKWFLLLPIILVSTCWGINLSSNLISSDEEISTKEYISASTKKETLIDLTSKEIDQIKEQTKPTSSDFATIEAKELKSEFSHSNRQTNKEIKKVNRFSMAKTPKSIPSFSTISDYSLSKTVGFLNSIESNIKPKSTVQAEFDSNNITSNTIIAENDTRLKDLMLYLQHPPLMLFKQANVDLFPINNEPQYLSDPIVKPKSIRSNSHFYIKAISELGLLNRNRKFDTNNPNYIELLTSFEDTESTLFAMTHSLFAGYQTASGLSFQSGIEYQELREVFKNSTFTSETLLIPGEIRYLIFDGLDTIEVRDTAIVNRETERKIRHYNKHTLYSIPIQIGYKFKLKRINFIPRLGLSYTFSNTFKGRANKISAEETIEVFDNTSFTLKNRIGLLAGLAVEVPFNNRSKLFATASYRRSPKFTADLIEQTYHSISIGAGFRFSISEFNKN